MLSCRDNSFVSESRGSSWVGVELAIAAMPAKTKKSKAAVYARISSTSQKDGSGIKRQTSRCKATCKAVGDKVACEVSEVISASLPVNDRKVFNQLLHECKSKGITKIIVEGTRAFARSAHVAEILYEKSKGMGITIIPVDVPDLCVHDPNPAQKFIRRVMFAFTELEKDLSVTRLQHGWQQRLKQEKKKFTSGQKTVRLNQKGLVKINGRKSILENKNLSGQDKMQLKQYLKKYQQGKITVRELAKRLSGTLKLAKVGSL